MRNDNESIKFDLAKIVDGIMRRLWAVILTMVVGGVVLFSVAAFMITPKYQASALMYVNNSSFSVGATNFSISTSQLTAAKSLVETYLVILKSRLTLNEVIERGDLDLSYGQLHGMISAGSVNNTEVFSVTVTSTDPQEAEHIANTIAQVLPGKIAGVVEGSSVNIVDYAVVPSDKVSPDVKMYTIAGLMIGLILSCAIIVLIEVLDDQIRSEGYLLENYPDIPLLTVIPDLMGDRDRKGYYYYKGGYYRSGYYRSPEEDEEAEEKIGKKKGAEK